MKKSKGLNEKKQFDINCVGRSVSFYQDSKQDKTDTGTILCVIDSEKENPIYEIKPNKMNYDKVWRTHKEIL